MNERLVRALAVLAMALLFIGAIMMVDWPKGGVDQIDSKEVAKTMFGVSGGSGYGLIVLLIGLLLLVALLGGVFLAKEERP
jgi:NADH:ubiquinone oxidoreductase subunit 6 (subunit J)